ncbi:HlyC/CorC family transporter [Aquidulcibacter paucihalophilus]|uniref:HlyC/CorC family transporter n=1 Tax=Aquidulcibacter paucihalophilus TaxID=1978549 RepID=UPI000A19AAF7|nr:HlyC/CorC family transporter [Aquidulcibacter paucihalophilus]
MTIDPTVIVTAISVAVLIAMSAFYSAAETSITSSSRARMFQLEKEGDRAAARVNRLIQNPDRLIGSLLLGNNFLNTLAGALTTALLVQLFGQAPTTIAIATALVTAIVLIFAEVMPKTFAFSYPEATARWVSLPVQWSVTLLSPIVTAVRWIVRATLQIFGVKLDRVTDEDATMEEIRGAIELGKHEGSVEKSDRDRVAGVLDLEELDVSDVMIHRKNMKTIDVELPSREIVMQVLQTQHSRLPLYEGDQENIVGILHAKDLLQAIADAQGDLDAIDLKAIIRQPWFVPDTTTLKEQLEEFLKRRSHVACVVDEYGALQGLVTLEDILEEIVGDIVDEHDIAIQGVRPQPDGSVNVDGAVPIRDLNRAMDWDLPDEEAVTIAGLVIHEAQAIPDPGQRFAFHGYRFQILRKHRNQILAIRITPEVASDKDEVGRK